jgi:hypothetical protein
MDFKNIVDRSPATAAASLPSLVVVRDLSLSYRALREAADSGTFLPGGQAVCCLEVGGKRIAEGEIVRSGGGYRFRVTRMAEGGEE